MAIRMGDTVFALDGDGNEVEVCAACGSPDYLDEDMVCRSPECEGARADAAEITHGPDR